jgi:hypothetical protein
MSGGMKLPPGWETFGATFCKTTPTVRAEVTPGRPYGALLRQWHVLVWRGNDRRDTILSVWVDTLTPTDAVAIAEEAFNG